MKRLALRHDETKSEIGGRTYRLARHAFPGEYINARSWLEGMATCQRAPLPLGPPFESVIQIILSSQEG